MFYAKHVKKWVQAKRLVMRLNSKHHFYSVGKEHLPILIIDGEKVLLLLLLLLFMVYSNSILLPKAKLRWILQH